MPPYTGPDVVRNGIVTLTLSHGCTAAAASSVDMCAKIFYASLLDHCPAF